MLRKNLRDESTSDLREAGISCPAIFGAWRALDQTTTFESVNQPSHAAAGDQQLLLEFAQQRRTTVMQRLQHAKLGKGELMFAYLGLSAGTDRLIGAGKYDPEFECFSWHLSAKVLCSLPSRQSEWCALPMLRCRG